VPGPVQANMPNLTHIVEFIADQTTKTRQRPPATIRQR
jgi:hypothetical protein